MAKQETKGKSPAKTDSKSYQAMLNELDEIVREVSQGKLDLDDVVGKIEHGYELIGTMRQRLDQTRAKVEKLRVDFEASTSQPKPSKTIHNDKRDPDAEDNQDEEDLPF
jgi:exodeoxyribonuclease VII small subunit